MQSSTIDSASALDALSGPVRDWFVGAFPGGPTSAQRLAWPRIALRENALIVSPTGSGKTLAAFLGVIDRLHQEWRSDRLAQGIRCVYVSPLRSLGYDIERNLSLPLESIREVLKLDRSPISIGVRTGDTSAYQRRKLRDDPPHILITTPESLSLLLSQDPWHAHWKGVEYLVVDEVHALVPTKRGADLAVSLERLAAMAGSDPCRIGLSATCRPAEPVARFLVGPTRDCQVLEASLPDGSPPLELKVESLIKSDEAPHRGLTYRRLLRRLERAMARERTTVIFANTRALTEKITHDLRGRDFEGAERVAAHHSALDATRRREVETALKAGELHAVVTSTSLELGVDIGTADLAVQVGLPGGVSRCLQRVGRSGHNIDAPSRGLLLAATPAELAGLVVTAKEARAGRVEPLRAVSAPLDVLCQQLVGMACGGEWSSDSAFHLIRKAGPMADLSRTDFDACLDFLAGELAAPPGAYEPEPGATPRWTSPRIWKKGGYFGVRSRRVVRWFWGNVGTINSEESVRVLADGVDIGTLEGSYADRLQRGDRFVLDGRALEFVRLDGFMALVKNTGGDPGLPRWTSDRQGLSANLAAALSAFREEAAKWLDQGAEALAGWLREVHDLGDEAAWVLAGLFEAQEQISEIPSAGTLLIEESPHDEGWTYAFHAPLSRAACEALGRGVAARLGRQLGRNLAMEVADLGFTLQIPDETQLQRDELSALLTPANFFDDVMEGLDRGELAARRFRHIASTALMVLRNPDGGRRRVGGTLWVSNRLYPLIQAACPRHPLLRETRREILEDLLDAPGALAWIEGRPEIRFRALSGPSPFARAWIDPAQPEGLQFESPADALRRLHARLMSTSSPAAEKG